MPLDDDFIGSLEGCDIQDAAEACGLLIPTEVTEACGDNCNCAGCGDFPQTCYRPSPTMIRAIKAAATPQEDPTDGR